MNSLRVLFIEDSESDAALIVRQLEKAGYLVTAERVETESQFSDALKISWDVIIADYQLPEYNAPAALSFLKETRLDIPFIVVSGAIGEEMAVALMKFGACDYLMKDKLMRLPPVIERELAELSIRQAQKKSHLALAESECNLRNSQAIAHVGHWVFDVGADIETWSDELWRIFGLVPTENNDILIQTWINAIHPEDRVRVIKSTNPNHPENLEAKVEYRVICPDGSIRHVLSIRGDPAVDDQGRVIQTNGVVLDITERKLIEIDLRDKMEESRLRARELETITSVSSRLRKAISHDELVESVVHELTTVLNADHVTLGILKGEEILFNYAVHHNKPEHTEAMFKLSGRIGDLIQNKTPFYLEEIPHELLAELKNWVGKEYDLPKCLIFYPLICHNNLCGIIYLGYDQKIRFSQEQKNLVSAISEMAGNALNRIKATSDLEAMVKTRDNELESIYKVTSSASSTLDLHQALRSALLLSLEAVQTARGAIYLYDDTEKQFQLVSSFENEVEFTPFFKGKLINKHLKKVIEQKKTVVILDAGGVDKTNGDEKDWDKYSFVGLPMRAQDRVTGVMVVIRDPSSQINLDEMTLLSFIADHLALVVDNTRLFKKAEHTAIMEERSRLARELHDSVTQSLYSANMYASGAQKFYQIGKYAEIASYLTQIGGLVQQALKDMRLLVYELRSPELALNGLLGAIQIRLDAVERRLGIMVSVEYEWATSLPEPIEQEVYRIIIEALNNSIKYAHASSGAISFLTNENGLTLTIEDNGVGFVLEQGLQSGGVGLTTMRERAENLGGELNIRSSHEHGTTIEVILPIPQLKKVVEEFGNE